MLTESTREHPLHLFTVFLPMRQKQKRNQREMSDIQDANT